MKLISSRFAMQLAFAIWAFAACSWAFQHQLAKRVGVMSSPKEVRHSLPLEAEPDRHDFTEVLPPSANPESVISGLNQAVTVANVVLVSVRSGAQNATPQSLGRYELQVSLQGTYTGIKQVLGDVLARYPHVVLKHLNIHRMSGPLDLEAVVDLQILTRPLPVQTTLP